MITRDVLIPVAERVSRGRTLPAGMTAKAVEIAEEEARSIVDGRFGAGFFDRARAIAAALGQGGDDFASRLVSEASRATTRSPP